MKKQKQNNPIMVLLWLTNVCVLCVYVCVRARARARARVCVCVSDEPINPAGTGSAVLPTMYTRKHVRTQLSPVLTSAEVPTRVRVPAAG